MSNEKVEVGEVVEWGPAEYPHSGIVRGFSRSGEYAFVQDERNVYTQVAVTKLRRPAVKR